MVFVNDLLVNEFDFSIIFRAMYVICNYTPLACALWGCSQVQNEFKQLILHYPGETLLQWGSIAFFHNHMRTELDYNTLGIMLLGFVVKRLYLWQFVYVLGLSVMYYVAFVLGDSAI